MEKTITVLKSRNWGNAEDAVALIQRLIEKHDLPVQIHEIIIETFAEAEKHKFLGSPTIQINGLDIDPSMRSRTDYGFTWRFYAEASGVPPEDLIMLALHEAGWL